MFNPLGRGPKYGRKRATVSAFFSGKWNEFAKRAYRAKRVHQYSLNIGVFLKNLLSALTALSEFIS